MSPAPEIAVVVPSSQRPLRLRWLLNALEEQTLALDRFEVVVCHDSASSETEELLERHPLAGQGVLRYTSAPPSAPPGLQRNRAWRLARAPLIAFTDDDCRPPPDWLERALASAHRNPGQVVQGATRPDPDEFAIALHAPHARTQSIDPPVAWAQTCNIVYPRELLERLAGFDEAMQGGEDAELAQRAIGAGAALVGAPDVLTYHAVHARGLVGTIKTLPRWQHLADLVKRHPELRRDFVLGLFWRDSHALLLLALGGAALNRRPLARAALAIPWALRAAPSYGGSPRGRIRAVAELPGRAVIDLVELAVLVRGSVRYRTILL
jgi:glycosyltransferase involved in cell wall biosynthesis